MSSLELSKVSNVLAIKKNLRRGTQDIICQVASISKHHPDYKYINCFVTDDEHHDRLKKFSFKMDTPYFGLALNVAVGDVVLISKPLRNTASRRSSSNYVLTPNDIDLQIYAGANTTLKILSSLQNGLINNFSLINAPRSNASLCGVVDTVPAKDGAKWYMILSDDQENVMEIILKDKLKTKIGEKWVIKGDIRRTDGIFYMESSAVPEKYVDGNSGSGKDGDGKSKVEKNGDGNSGSGKDDDGKSKEKKMVMEIVDLGKMVMGKVK